MNIAALVTAVIALLVGGFAAFDKPTIETPMTVGGQYEQYDHQWFQRGFSAGPDREFVVSQDGIVSVPGGLTQGGGITNLTDANGGTYTLTQAELSASSVLKFAAGGAGQAVIALTLPATSTLTTLLPNAGDFRTWVYDASALASATTTTWTAGTGIDLIAYTTNDDVIDGAEFSQLTCWRQADTDVSCIVSELLHSD